MGGSDAIEYWNTARGEEAPQPYFSDEAFAQKLRELRTPESQIPGIVELVGQDSRAIYFEARPDSSAVQEE